MKRIAVLALMGLLSVVAVTSVTAQRGGAKGPKTAFWASLNLTEDQQAQIKELHLRMREQKDQSKLRGERPSKEQLEALGTEYDQALSAILTADQQGKLAQMKGSGRGRYRSGQGDGHRRPSGLRRQVLATLDLSEEQRDAIKELREARRAQMKKLRASRERPTRAELRARREAMKESFAAILTPDQLARLEEIKSQGKGSQPRGHRQRRPLRELRSLDLSEDQQSRLKALRERATEERAARRASGERPTTEERKVQRDAMEAAVAEILTPEQRLQLEERRAARGVGEGPDAMRSTESGFARGEAPATIIESRSWGRIKVDIQ